MPSTQRIQLPAALWSFALALSSTALGVWVLRYLFEPRHMLLSATELQTVGDQLAFATSADIPLLYRLFFLSPWLAFLLAVVAVVLGVACLRGLGWAVWAAAATVLAVPTIYFVGMALLRRLESPIFFDKSPWVSTFQVGCLASAVLALIALGWGAVALTTARRSPEVVDAVVAAS